jgi:glycosyltransferase involved in cell wall biosynthesis
MDGMRAAPAISLVIPVYNEESTVRELLSRTGEVLDRLPGGAHEIVLIDDGSRDRTLEILTQAAAEDSRIVVVALSRNFGHQPALSAGLDHARGDVVIVMDGDLQDDPEAIPHFVDLYRQGYDVVYAQRVRRKEPFWLRFAYSAFYRFLAGIAEVALPTDAGDFGLMSRQVLREIQRAPERNRYLRGLRAWAGFRQIGVPVERTHRYAGRSKYNLWRLTKLALDGIFAFSIAPIRAVAVLGVAAIGVSSLYGLYALYAKLVLDRSPQGFTALVLLMIFLSGINLFFLGVIGEYVGRVYGEVKERPVYIVGQVIRKTDAGFTASSQSA